MFEENNIYKNQLVIGHWNCNAINTKKIIFNKFIRDNNFDIFRLNETKLDDRNKTKFELFNYSTILKNRNRNDIGVGILIKNGIKYEQIQGLNSLNYEILGVKLKLINHSINIFSFYLPPDNQKNRANNQLSDELFLKLDQHRPYILVGDLNCHSKSWFCKQTFPKGAIPEDLLLEHNLTVVNTRKNTYSHFTADSESVIDLMIVADEILHLFDKYQVHNNNMTSDHYPISGVFHFKTQYIKNPYTIIKKKTDWKLFAYFLDPLLMELNKEDQDQASLEVDYSHLTTAIKQAEIKATKETTRKINYKTVPVFLLEFIKTRKSIVKELKKDKNNQFLKTRYNFFTKLIKSEFKSLRENMWTKFCKSLDTTKKEENKTN